jgi:hypothetical protein
MEARKRIKWPMSRRRRSCWMIRVSGQRDMEQDQGSEGDEGYLRDNESEDG